MQRPYPIEPTLWIWTVEIQSSQKLRGIYPWNDPETWRSNLKKMCFGEFYIVQKRGSTDVKAQIIRKMVGRV